MAMNRRKVREHAFRMLFSCPFHEDAQWEDQLLRYADLHGALEAEDPEEMTEEDFAEVAAKAKGVEEHIAEIDARLNALSEGWKVNRMNKVDLTLLRLAVYEHDYEGLSKSIVINEAVELAKAYGEERSGSFVNGVLAKM